MLLSDLRPEPGPPEWLVRLLDSGGGLVVMWTAALALAGMWLWIAWHHFSDHPAWPPEWRRGDGNDGHVQLDFGGQWLMGRMVVCGHARQLYHRQRQWEVARAAFPVEHEPPYVREQVVVPPERRQGGPEGADVRHDAERLMSWLMGEDPPEWKQLGGAAAVLVSGDGWTPQGLWTAHAAAVNATVVTPELVARLEEPAVGGQLYPPVHAFVYTPLGLLPPQPAYRLMQLLSCGLVFVAARGLSRISGGWLPWPAAALLLLVYPGTRSAMILGQNAVVTLTIVVWGWVYAVRGRDLAAGLIWGLLAYKPSWAVAFTLVPLLMGRWRFLAAMVLSGGAAVLLTLPWVGWQGWRDWLRVGQDAAALYSVDYNWIHLSRDLHGIPRRFLLDFDRPATARDSSLARLAAWSLWGCVLLGTAVIYRRAADRRCRGLGAAFLLLGAWLSCYHFMYYDVLLTALVFAVLFAEPRYLLTTRRLICSEPFIPLPGSSASNSSSATGGRAQAQAVSTAAASLVRPEPATTDTPAVAWNRIRWTGWTNSFPATILALILIIDGVLVWSEIRLTIGLGNPARTAGEGAAGQITLSTGIRYPWDTLLLLGLWLWAGVRLLGGVERQLAADRTDAAVARSAIVDR